MITYHPVICLFVLVGVLHTLSLTGGVLAEFDGENDDTRKWDTGPRLLIFGGNGFIGAETVVALLENGFNRITIVNRGRWRWDTATRVKPHVKQITCDRTEPLNSCNQLVDELKTVGTYDFVVDFSAYQGYQMEYTVKFLAGKVGLYLYISTDSVYEVCDKKAHDGATRETDAIRPSSEYLREKLQIADRYGHEKLLAEEVLENQRKDGGFPFVFLRLPDVIGPRETSQRWWFYQLWLQTFDVIRKPVHVPRKISGQFLSFVQVDDVSKAVIEIIKAGNKFNDQSFNLALDANLTLVKVLKDMGSELGIKHVLFDTADLAPNFFLYPSVKNGPIDTTKVKNSLSWNPQYWPDVVNKNIAFYDDVMKSGKFPDETYEVFERFISALVPDAYLKRFVRRVIQLYGQQIRENIPYDVDLAEDLAIGHKLSDEL